MVLLKKTEKSIKDYTKLFIVKMIKIDLDQLGHDLKFELDDSVIAAFVTGSYVNGYFRDDSDIDVVAISKLGSKPIQNLDRMVSLHYLPESFFNYFGNSEFYSVLRNVPLHNSEYVMRLSTKTKKEMVIKESKRLQRMHQRKGNKNPIFTSWDIISRYFTRRWGIIEPSRLTPLNRLLTSNKSRKILEGEYSPIFDELERSRFLIRSDEGYLISPDSVLNNDYHEGRNPLNEFAWLFRESKGGLLYFMNRSQIARNIRTIYYPKPKND